MCDSEISLQIMRFLMTWSIDLSLKYMRKILGKQRSYIFWDRVSEFDLDLESSTNCGDMTDTLKDREMFKGPYRQLCVVYSRILYTQSAVVPVNTRGEKYWKSIYEGLLFYKKSCWDALLVIRKARMSYLSILYESLALSYEWPLCEVRDYGSSDFDY